MRRSSRRTEIVIDPSSATAAPLRTRTVSLVFLGAAASGISTFLSLPAAGLAPLAWFALAPLGAAIASAPGVRHAFAAGLVFGVAQLFPLLVWIPSVLVRFGGIAPALAWPLYALVTLFLASFPAVGALVIRLVVERFGRSGLLVFPFAWVALELARAHVGFGGFPWLQIGYSQTPYLRLVQISDCTGVYGVTFLVAWINTALVVAAGRALPPARRFVPLVAGLVMVASTLAYGTAALSRWGGVRADRTAALLQGNLSVDDPEPLLEWKFREGYAEMARTLGPAVIDLGVLPESPAPLDFERDPVYRGELRALARRFALGLVFNNTRITGTGRDAAYYNSAFFLSSRGELLGSYDKVHLVPFGEYVPLRRLFFFAESITRDVSDFSSGERPHNVSVAGYPVSAIICFESIFPHLVRELVRDGGSVIVNLTNDGWYGPSAAPHQHLAMARWRAVENRRYLLRAANSGISAVIAPTGALEGETRLFRREVALGRFAFLSEATLYTAAGDLFAVSCAMISLVFAALGVGLPRRAHERNG